MAALLCNQWDGIGALVPDWDQISDAISHLKKKKEVVNNFTHKLSVHYKVYFCFDASQLHGFCFCLFVSSMSRRGFIMGVWNSHTSVGNILGSLIAGVFVSSAWGMSFIVPGIIIASCGILCFFFLVESQFLTYGCNPSYWNTAATWKSHRKWLMSGSVLLAGLNYGIVGNSKPFCLKFSQTVPSL